MTGIDFKTYTGDAAAGGVVRLARPANSLALSAHGTSVFWVRPRAKSDAVAAPAGTPAAAAQSVADGWIRVAGAESPPSASASGAGFPATVGVPFTFPADQQVVALEIWCEAAGYLAVVATA